METLEYGMSLFDLAYLYATPIVTHPMAPIYAALGGIALWMVRISRKFSSKPVSNEKSIAAVQQQNDERLEQLKNREKLKKRILQLVIGQGLDDFSINKGSPFHLSRKEVEEMKAQIAFALGLPGLAPVNKKKLAEKVFKTKPASKLPVPPAEDNRSLEDKLAAINSRQAA